MIKNYYCPKLSKAASKIKKEGSSNLTDSIIHLHDDVHPPCGPQCSQPTEHYAMGDA